MADMSSNFELVKRFNNGSLSVTVVLRLSSPAVYEAGRGQAGPAVTDTDELSHGSAFRIPMFLRDNSLCARLPVSRADQQ